MSARSFKIGILLVFTLGLALRIAWVYLIPLWQQADEYPHFYYVQHIHEYKTFPLSQPVFPFYEAFQPPMYYLLSAGIYNLIPSWDDQDGMMGESIDVAWESVNFQNHNRMARLLRWLSVVLWIGTFWVSYRFLARFFRNKKEIILLGLSLLAFLPTYVSNSSSISNDSLAILVSTLFIYLLSVAEPKKCTHLLLLGVVLGWAILTKYNCLVLVPALLIYVWMFQKREFMRVIFPVLGVAAVLIIPWFFFTHKMYGEILALNPGFGTDFSFWHHSGTEFYHVLRNLFWSFWAAAGRAYEIHLPIWYYVFVFGGITAVSGWGLLRLWLRRKNAAQLDSASLKIAGWSGLVLLLLVAASLWYSLSYQVMTSWGKNLYVGILPIALLLSLGWQQISANRYWLYFLPVLLLLTDLFYMFGYVFPHFHE